MDDFCLITLAVIPACLWVYDFEIFCLLLTSIVLSSYASVKIMQKHQQEAKRIFFTPKIHKRCCTNWQSASKQYPCACAFNNKLGAYHWSVRCIQENKQRQWGPRSKYFPSHDLYGSILISQVNSFLFSYDACVHVEHPIFHIPIIWKFHILKRKQIQKGESHVIETVWVSKMH